MAESGDDPNTREHGQPYVGVSLSTTTGWSCNRAVGRPRFARARIESDNESDRGEKRTWSTFRRMFGERIWKEPAAVRRV